MLEKFWRLLKQQRRLRLGPATLSLYFIRTPPLRAPPRHSTSSKIRHQGRDQGSHSSAQDSTDIATHCSVQTALLFGVGPGLGEALAHTLAVEGFSVGLVARDGVRLERMAELLRENGRICKSYSCDVTHEPSVESLFRDFTSDFGAPSLVVYGLQSFGPGETLDVEVPAFEAGWRHNCFGAFLVARGATRVMIPKGTGTLVFVGSTSSLIGREGHLNLAVGKFGQRALAQVLAREVWAKGIHVAHLIIDADIREGTAEDHPQAEPSDISKAVLFLHQQPRSAWTSEMDIRPSSERFWEHC